MPVPIQLPAPKVEPTEQPLHRLAYTRRTGWCVVYRGEPYGGEPSWRVRPGAKLVMEYDILAWADLPPVPATAA